MPWALTSVAQPWFASCAESDDSEGPAGAGTSTGPGLTGAGTVEAGPVPTVPCTATVATEPDPRSPGP